MFLTNKQKAKKFDKLERQRKDIVRLRAEMEALQKDIDDKISKLKTLQEKLKTMLEEILVQKPGQKQ